MDPRRTLTDPLEYTDNLDNPPLQAPDSLSWIEGAVYEEGSGRKAQGARKKEAYTSVGLCPPDLA